MSRPLVSILTPTIPERHALLVETLHDLRQQSYPELEHVIVVEDPDPEAVTRVRAAVAQQARAIPTTVAQTGRRWTTFLKNSRNAAPIIAAQLLARGDYLLWLADDERLLDPDHITKLVDLLERTGADFAYPKVRMWHIDHPGRYWIIGTDPPVHGQITHVLYRAELIETALTQLGHGECPDWLQIDAWMKAGATWAFLPDVTIEHRADV